MSSVWHYTSVDGLRGIVENDVLWATSHRFMNDSAEPHYATAVLRGIADTIATSLSVDARGRFDDFMKFAARSGLEAFLLCAAREPDLLTVWRGYGSSVSYAIELDASVPLLPIEQCKGDDHPSPPAGWGPEYEYHDGGERTKIFDPDQTHVESTVWGEVQYDSAIARTRVEHIANLARSEPNDLSDNIVPFANLGGIDLLQLKNAAFADERESRMVFEVSPRWKFVKHRTSRFGLTPYIEVSAATGADVRSARGDYLRTASKLPIRSVTIGPSPLGPESTDALREYLEFRGYPDVPVARSETPFR